MKKIVPVMLALAIVSGGAATVSAETAENVQTVSGKKGNHFRHMAHMKNFQEEIHQANKLEMERLEIKKEIVQKKDKLFELHMKAAEKGNQEKKSGKKAIWQDMKKIHQELKALKKEAHETKRSMHDAMRSDDERLASDRMDKWLSINERINAKLSEKSAKLDEVIAQYK